MKTVGLDRFGKLHTLNNGKKTVLFFKKKTINPKLFRFSHKAIIDTQIYYESWKRRIPRTRPRRQRRRSVAAGRGEGGKRSSGTGAHPHRRECPCPRPRVLRQSWERSWGGHTWRHRDRGGRFGGGRSAPRGSGSGLQSPAAPAPSTAARSSKTGPETPADHPRRRRPRRRRRSSRIRRSRSETGAWAKGKNPVSGGRTVSRIRDRVEEIGLGEA